MGVDEELRTYLQVLWRYKWVIAVCAFIAALVAFGVSTRLTPIFSVTATVRVASAPGGATDYVYMSGLTRLSNTYVEIANSEVSLREVAKRLGLKELPNIKVAIIPETELIEINASDPDPGLARDIANTLANLMTEQSVQLYGGNAPTARQILERQLAQAKVDLDGATSEYERALRISQSSATRTENATSVPNPDLETLSQVLYVRQQIYTDLLTKYEEARTSEQLHANAITIIELASLPLKPSTPNLPLNTILGFSAGLATGVILAFLLESMDDTLRGIEDVQSLTSLPILCTIPAFNGRLGMASSLHLLQKGHLSFAPAFHQLRSRLTLPDVKPKDVTYLITSPEPGTGKSTIATNLAVSLAEGGNRVVLIDMDIYRPQIHFILNLPNEKGFGNLIRGETPWNTVLQTTSTPNLRVVTVGSNLDQLFEWLTPDKISSLLKHLEKETDYVLIDAPAFLSVAEPTIIASQVDAVIMVVARRSTERKNLRLALQQLAELDFKVAGIVVNKMPKLQLYHYYSVQRQRQNFLHKFGHRRVVAVQSGSPVSKKE